MGGNAQDSLIELLIESATEKLERDVERCFVTATWEQSHCAFPDNSQPIYVYMGGAKTINTISYLDPDGVLTTLDPAGYSYDIGRNSITCLLDDDGWPETLVTESGRDTVFVSFTCGVSDPDCLPRLFKHGILLEVGRAYFDPAQENSTANDNGKSYQNIVKGLLRANYP